LEQLTWTSIAGIRFKLETVGAVKGSCCRNIAVVRIGSNGRADLSCADCKAYRGRLPEHAITGLLEIFKLFPKAKDEVHVVRDKELRFYGNS
jgi:hypothetical protein